MMKVLIFGGSGMLGHKLLQVLKENFDVYTTIHSDFNQFKHYNLIDSSKIFDKIDVEKFDEINNLIKKIKPSFVINSVGLIKQLPKSKDLLKTFEINSIFPQKLSRIAEYYGFKLINISTDCVFNGKKGDYVEEDQSDAEDIYGKSKFLGEVFGNSCLTIRTSIIGRELASKHSLIEWFMSNAGGITKGYKNAIFTGFPTIVLAEILADIIQKHPYLEGLYHVSSDAISKYDLLTLINRKFDLGIQIEPFEDFYIDRSLNSSKFRKVTGFEPLSWDKMVQKMVDDDTPYLDWKK